ncbi:hypothetical protein CHGG_00712 [Chaetomium globosum CBS 148.51]|uniref:J domain-containing protein n=1 Tax=Chaetomium globosum (strain ATCC 6205 / CBS 148.51 / DSM 1962 / NBRC 6347 / NRRL 1970) TaxID=306901 RepID=Q2HGE2_CHAGB|nr:uncharacterized protein CHGG_00712 [Chaetomium globosum CBS 148.51]EAQ92477.1 hypothetical protein CHGG_00712 [Chaetomium globosum CBS 148.51]
MSALLSLLGWSFLPNLVTGWTQSLYYSITIRAGDPKPQPGTPRWAEHRLRIHIAVVALYLLYTIYEADYDLQRAGTYYTDLGVPLDATEREIKSRFRRLAALHHPDKVSSSTVGGSGPTHEDINAYFVHLKMAADALADPARRFTYERFGPDVVGWMRCMTAHSVTRPGMPRVLERVVNPLLGRLAGRPPYLPFQAIALARKLSVTVYIAFSQIGPLLAADTRSGQLVVSATKGGDDEKALREGLERLEAAVKRLDVDTTRLLETEMAPFAGTEDTRSTMWAKVKEWLVQNTIRSDPMVRDALGKSFAKRRMEAPAGARGTK